MATPMDASDVGMNGPLHRASDRVVLDVGGVKFISAVSTLTTNSAYFAAQLSGAWGDVNDDEARAIFLDQDPDSFRKLLSYMREGMIDVNTIDKGVVLLAEYLGVEKLLLAIKARSYRNLHPGLIDILTMSDDEAAREFDNKYGGIRHALARGILIGSLRKDTAQRKEFAVMHVGPHTDRHGPAEDKVKIILQAGGEGGERDDLRDLNIIGSLNWLHHHGYTRHEAQLNTECGDIIAITFSRSRSQCSTSTDTVVFVPDDKFLSMHCAWKKEFAMIMVHKESSRCWVQAKVFGANTPSDTHMVENEGAWLERNRFVDREVELENLLRPWITPALMNYFGDYGEFPYQIYSRKIEYLAGSEDDPDERK